MAAGAVWGEITNFKDVTLASIKLCNAQYMYKGDQQLSPLYINRYI